MSVSDRPSVFVVLASSALWLLAFAIAGACVGIDKAIDHLLGGNR